MPMISSIALALISNNPGAMVVGPALMQTQNLRYSRLFEKEGREWKNFFARVLELADKPKDERKMLLNQER